MRDPLWVEIGRAVRAIATPVVVVGDDLVPLNVGLTNAGVDMIADSIMALIEQSRPSREEFAETVECLLTEISEHGLWAPMPLDGGLPDTYNCHVESARREVMRMAGYPEER